jgi:hypothetical protein
MARVGTGARSSEIAERGIKGSDKGLVFAVSLRKVRIRQRTNKTATTITTITIMAAITTMVVEPLALEPVEASETASSAWVVVEAGNWCCVVVETVVSRGSSVVDVVVVVGNKMQVPDLHDPGDPFGKHDVPSASSVPA